MSKWIKQDLFNEFVQERQSDESSKKGSTVRRSDTVWQTPQMGTQDKAKIYEVRFLPDPNGKFYKKFYYHGFKSGERWYFPLCTKTHDFYNWCPFCAAASKLYMGTATDKTQASVIKRKEKFVGNIFVIDDPRDADKTEDTAKVVGTVKLYEFPAEVESKIKSTITDAKHGLGASVFDPGEEGYNFIVKVKATKPTAQGKQWPVYADSEFARRSSTLGTDKQIQTIMSSTINIDDYVNGQSLPDEDVIAILKNEMLWEIVKDEWTRYKGKVTGNGEAKMETPKETPKPEPSSMKNQEKDVPDSIGAKEETDDELLKELDEL
jgi:hypothetical protein